MVSVPPPQVLEHFPVLFNVSLTYNLFFSWQLLYGVLPGVAVAVFPAASVAVNVLLCNVPLRVKNPVLVLFTV